MARVLAVLRSGLACTDWDNSTFLVECVGEMVPDVLRLRWLAGISLVMHVDMIAVPALRSVGACGELIRSVIVRSCISVRVLLINHVILNTSLAN